MLHQREQQYKKQILDLKSSLDHESQEKLYQISEKKNEI